MQIFTITYNTNQAEFMRDYPLILISKIQNKEQDHIPVFEIDSELIAVNAPKSRHSEECPKGAFPFFSLVAGEWISRLSSLLYPLQVDARVTKPSVTVRRSFTRGRSYLFAQEERRRKESRIFHERMKSFEKFEAHDRFVDPPLRILPWPKEGFDRNFWRLWPMTWFGVIESSGRGRKAWWLFYV